MRKKLFMRPSDPVGSGSEADVTAEDGPEAVLDPVLQLQADLITAKGESDEWQDRFLRKAAEFDNYRKRTEKEKSESVLLAKSAVLAEFLHVVDGCERALDSFAETKDQSEGLEQYREGIQLLYRQLLNTLARFGVVPIEAKGKKFDPHLHDALSRMETDEYEENTVVQELRKGYLFKDRLLRPCQVRVAIRPAEEPKPAED